MSELTFKTLQQELMKRYRAKGYVSALELIETEQANFPADFRTISYWRMCILALLNRQEEALSVFREVLERGEWFAPRMLEEDPDLVSLRTLPEFQNMAESSRAHLAEIQGGVQPELLVKQPAETADKQPLLLALHGNASNAQDTIEYWDGITAHNWLLAVPQSSQIIGINEYVWDEREPGISEIKEHLTRLASEYPLDLERVVLGGFSMGGGQAIWMALHQSIPARGFVALGPWLRAAELEALPTLLEQQKPAHLRGFILVGDEDQACLEVSRKVAEIMRTYDLPCELEIYPGLDHIYPPDFVERVERALAFIEQV